ncbi:MAG: arylsulfatase [Hyphomonadaceae bacterium]|nr:arylsulfatase [Hyphomonadaceae bacterium]
MLTTGLRHYQRVLQAITCAGLTAALTGSVAAAPQTPKRPNFLVIVADDLGYSDIGAFGGEISTPNLDRLAYQGLRFTGFHTAPTCSPTRAMLMSGTDNHRAGLGSMSELMSPNQRGKPGHEGYLRTDIAALPEVLQANGYRTLMSGKWHLGLTPEQDPHARGFDKSFALLQGAGNHFGADLSVDPSKGATYRQNGVTLTSLPKDFYSSDAFAERLIGFLRDAPKSDGASKPFFALLAFSAPHYPLQALPEDIARYRGRYDKGFEALREERLNRQAELGLIDLKKPVHALETGIGSWASLSNSEKQMASRDMEIYAAMVDRLDLNVGRVLDELARTGELDNTVVVFLSDNGAEGSNFDKPRREAVRARIAASDNRLANRGKANSYVGYGPGWAQAATAPSWLHKAFETEGGTRAAAFIRFPGFYRQGEISNAFLSVADIAPTMLEAAGIPNHNGWFEGRKVQPITGKSWIGYLGGVRDRVYGPLDAVGGELLGSRVLRQGDWKLTDPGDGVWRLFNIAADPGETNDLGAAQPDRRDALAKLWDDYAKDVGVVLPDERRYP